MVAKKSSGGAGLRSGNVRALFVTVINPLLEALETERWYVKERRDWSWRFDLGGLEAIRPIRNYVDSEAHPNYDHLLFVANPGLEKKVEDHDSKVQALVEGCLKFQSALETSGDFNNRYAEAIKHCPQGKTLADWIGTGLVDPKRLLAQYVVNNIEERPSHFGTAEFWRQYGKRFLELRQSLDLRKPYEATFNAGDRLAIITDRLISDLRDTRLNLSLLHDVPPAPLIPSPPSDRERDF